MMLITVSEDTLMLAPGNEVIFPHQKWEDYERLLQLRQEKKYPKLYFNAITQEIRLMSPLPSHGNRVDTLRDLVKILLRRQGKDWHCFDPITGSFSILVISKNLLVKRIRNSEVGIRKE